MDLFSKADEALQRGEAARREARLADAAAAFAEAAKLFGEADSPSQFAHALTRQAQVARDALRFNQARRFQEQALALTRRHGDAAALPPMVRQMADILLDCDDPEAAGALYAEMMDLYRKAPDTPPLELTNALRSLACHSEAVGNRREAAALWRDVRRRYADLDPVFRGEYGLAVNPGVEEADRRLRELGE